MFQPLKISASKPLLLVLPKVKMREENNLFLRLPDIMDSLGDSICFETSFLKSHQKIIDKNVFPVKFKPLKWSNLSSSEQASCWPEFLVNLTSFPFIS